MTPERRPNLIRLAIPPNKPPGSAKVRIGFARHANDLFKALPKNVQDGLLAKIKTVILNPNLAKPLVKDLKGCSRVTYGRLRCIVRLAEGVAVGVVIVVAPRKKGAKDDAYALASEYLCKNPGEVEELLARYIRAYLEEARMSTPPQRPKKKN